jgi:hypothetical protein
MRIISILLSLILLSIQCLAESAEEFANSYYQHYSKWGIRGVPSSSQLNQLSPLLGSEILQILSSALKQRLEFEQLERLRPKNSFAHNGRQIVNLRKAPWGEGDLFGHGEDIPLSNFTIGGSSRINKRVAIKINLEYALTSKIYSYTDTLILDRAANRWVVSDILFSEKDSLIEGMKKAIADVEAELIIMRKEQKHRNDDKNRIP